MTEILRENIRIDKGVARGPRNAPKARRRLPKADLGSWIIPTDLDAQQVLNRYLSESTTAKIAKSYGLSRKALVKWLREKVPEQWKQAQVIRALCRKEDSENDMDRSVDAISLSRVREQLRGSQWDLERLDSSNYGPKQEVTLQVNHRLIVKDALADRALELFKHARGIADAQPNKIIDLEPDAEQQPIKPSP